MYARSMARRILPCAPNPCMNGGTCEGSSGDVLCSCPEGFNGVACQQATEYNPAFCQPVLGTLEIHSEAVGGPCAPCVANEACFVGRWILGEQDYRGHIAAEPFGAQ